MCQCHKLLTFAVEDFSFNKEKFESFLTEIRACCGDEHIWLFMDNSGVHHCCKDAMVKLNITPVWNVAYSPEYNNAVEKYWAQLKTYFRPLLLSKMLKCPRAKDTPLRDAVRQTIRDVSVDSIPAFCQRGLETLRRDADSIKLSRKMVEVSHMA